MSTLHALLARSLAKGRDEGAHGPVALEAEFSRRRADGVA